MNRVYEVTAHPRIEKRVHRACSILSGRVILTTLEADGYLRMFCAVRSTFPDVLDSLGGASVLKDLTNQLLGDRLPF